jgi:hypothetical protein
MNVEIGTETLIFPFWEYLFQIFGILSLQCVRLRRLNNVVSVYLVQVSLLLIGQQGLVDFFSYQPLLPIGWRIVCAHFTPTPEANNQYSANYS